METLVVRDVPESFPHCIQRDDLPGPIDVERARQQHEKYVSTLRRHARNLIRIPADERFPDCCFIEDTAIVIGDRALITRPGAPTRLGEELAVRESLQKLGLTLRELPAPATLDGGDILFTGREIFAGQSERTDAKGIEALVREFPEYPVHPVPVEGWLHLKSFLNFVGDGQFVAADEDHARRNLGRIALESMGYQVHFLPESAAANCLRIEETLYIPSNHPKSALVYGSLGPKIVSLDMSEFEKADGGMTCLSLRIS